MKIGNLDTQNKTIIIAELSANHGQNIEIAKKTIESMKNCGADIVKIQSYTPDTITLKSDNPYFQIKQDTIWDGRTLYDLYSEAYTPLEWIPELYNYAREIGIEIFSSPFDMTSVDLLEEVNTPAYKIASFEITDIPLIKYTASKMKPMIISTGIATDEDIQLAIDACLSVGNKDICLLKCTSAYPAEIKDANLKTMMDMKERFNVEVGLSDHTIGTTVPIIATTMGARIIEKHFILDSNVGGPDASFSMEPKEFTELVRDIRDAENAIGKVEYSMTKKKQNSRKFARSLFISADIKKGEQFTNKNVRSVRPNDGLHPKYYEDIIGKTASEDLLSGVPLKESHIVGGLKK